MHDRPHDEGVRPSALQIRIANSVTDAEGDMEPAYHHLALQVEHNLQFQHRWTDLSVHTHSPLEQHIRLPRPLISGLPPRRLYVHPDEQAEGLMAEKRGGEKWAPKPEREWVLPTHLRENWSLRRMAAVFDGIGSGPPAPGLETGEKGKMKVSKWRETKRVALAVVEDDSTIVYYLVHDGAVKPRQN